MLLVPGIDESPDPHWQAWWPRNDPLPAFHATVDLADDWDAALADLGQAGHIKVASDFGPWPGSVAQRDRLHNALSSGCVL
jgi:predicted alpha/beta hydrolase family esterase